MGNLKTPSKYHHSINVLAQKKGISYLQKVQNKNFSVIGKYHLPINFLAQKKTLFPSPKSSKQELFSNQ